MRTTKVKNGIQLSFYFSMLSDGSETFEPPQLLTYRLEHKQSDGDSLRKPTAGFLSPDRKQGSWIFA